MQEKNIYSGFPLRFFCVNFSYNQGMARRSSACSRPPGSLGYITTSVSSTTGDIIICSIELAVPARIYSSLTGYIQHEFTNFVGSHQVRNKNSCFQSSYVKNEAWWTRFSFSSNFTGKKISQRCRTFCCPLAFWCASSSGWVHIFTYHRVNDNIPQTLSSARWPVGTYSDII